MAPDLRRRNVNDRLFIRQEPTESLDPVPSSSDLPLEPSSSSFFPSSSVTVVVPSIPSSVIPPPPPPTTSQPPPPPSSSITTVSSPSNAPSSPPTSSQSESVSLSESPLAPGPSTEPSLTSTESQSSVSSSVTLIRAQPTTSLRGSENVEALLPTSASLARGPGEATAPIVPKETESTTPRSVGGTSNGFWDNKGAVGATFAVVSLVAIGLATLAVITFFKRRNKSRQRKLDEEIYGDPPVSDDHHSSPGGSIHEKPLDPFSSNDVVYPDTGFQGPLAGVAYSIPDSNNVSTNDLYDATVRPYQEQTGYIPAPTPQLSDMSHASGHTAYWTPNASQQTISAPAQYMLPSQAQAQATANYYARTPDYPSTAQITIPSAPLVALNNGNPLSRESVDSFYGFKGTREPNPYPVVQ